MRTRLQKGFSLIELMIGVALGLIVLAALTSFFVSTSANRHEIERTSRQIENGRYAIDILRNEIHLAGFYAEIQQSGATWTMVDPCSVDVSPAGLGFQLAPLNVPLPIVGYTTDLGVPGCATDWLKGTDVIVVRRLGTEPITVAQAAAGNNGGQFFFQPSRCQTDSTTKTWTVGLGAASGNFDLQKVACGGNLSDVYRYRVTLFYIRNWSVTAGDNIPTLVKLELDNGAITVTPLVEGIQDLRFEYGLDTNLDGSPDEYRRCDADKPCTPDEWATVTAVRANVLAVNLEPTIGYVDTKEYDMGSGSGSTPRTIGPVKDNLKRHIYAAVVSAPNRTGPRE